VYAPVLGDFMKTLEIVETVQDLEFLRRMKKSVTSAHPMLKKPRPAAVVINFSGAILLQLFTAGMYVYTPKGRK
jgi:hypothetical protein